MNESTWALIKELISVKQHKKTYDFNLRFDTRGGNDPCWYAWFAFGKIRYDSGPCKTADEAVLSAMDKIEGTYE